MPTALYYLHHPFAPEPNNPPRFCAANVIVCDDKVLLEHRKDNFQWGIVSGSLHNDENFPACAIRRTEQETGIRLKETQLRELHMFDDPGRIVSYLEGNIYRVIHFAYYTELFAIPETKCGEESLELRWVPFSQLGNYSITRTHQDILEEYCRQKKIECTMHADVYRK
ncbi:MAG: NUDIX domain-containing protein [Solobacterium sp.]|jgi:8-oxo-dGTP pyrophosphatase MutT (NUDIX family)|nr:NUDIX domain-containing protein [Solobacterium sp.]